MDMKNLKLSLNKKENKKAPLRSGAFIILYP